MVDVHEYCWFEECTYAGWLAAYGNSRTGCDGLVDVPLDDVELTRVGQRADVVFYGSTVLTLA
jgi:hypothetical protein